MSSKTKKSETEKVQQKEVPLSLHDFCIRLSTKERRVELIAGFEADERKANRLKDTESAYAARFQAFIKRPA